MLSRFGFGHEATTASGSDAELAIFLEKEAEEAESKKKKNDQKQKQQTDEDRPKLFMELKWSEQRKMGQKAPVLRQVEGDSVNQRIRLIQTAKMRKAGQRCITLVDTYVSLEWSGGKPMAFNNLVYSAGCEGQFERFSTRKPRSMTQIWKCAGLPALCRNGGHEKIVQRLVDKAPVRRITINRKDACGEDHAGIAKLLLRKKAFIDETDSDGWSALHYAAANDAALAAEVLVQYDINLKARTESTKETALEMAERLRSHLVAILLYEVTYRKH
ncbi:Ankyrin repeat-containing domain [Phytophthora cactorum]|nr:Ankyrin repeat-containing domain [Phytophthora cactorum]